MWQMICVFWYFCPPVCTGLRHFIGCEPEAGMVHALTEFGWPDDCRSGTDILGKIGISAIVVSKP